MDAAVVTGILGLSGTVVTGALALLSTRLGERARIRETERAEIMVALRLLIDEQQETIKDLHAENRRLRRRAETDEPI